MAKLLVTEERLQAERARRVQIQKERDKALAEAASTEHQQKAAAAAAADDTGTRSIDETKEEGEAAAMFLADDPAAAAAAAGIVPSLTGDGGDTVAATPDVGGGDDDGGGMPLEKEKSPVVDASPSTDNGAVENAMPTTTDGVTKEQQPMKYLQHPNGNCPERSPLNTKMPHKRHLGEGSTLSEPVLEMILLSMKN